ncbi:MAG: hypothetical protein ACM3PZ_03155 [Bacillota bacterium]
MRKAALIFLALISVSQFSFAQPNRQANTVSAEFAPSSTATTLKFTVDGKQILIDREKFMAIYEQNLKLNENRFKDLDRIQIGDTIILTALNSNGYRYWVANAQTDGEIHECIWLISAKYILGSLPTQPATIQFTVDPEQSWWQSLNAEKIFFISLAATVLLVLLVLLTILIISLNKKRRIQQEQKLKEVQKFEHDKAQTEIAAAAKVVADEEAAEKDKDPENHPPVMSGGLSKDDQVALQQVSQAYGLNPTGVKKLERVTFIRDFGPHKVIAKMLVGASNQPAEIDLYVFPGEEVCKVTMVDDKIFYFKSHCGNRFGTTISNGEFTPPKGWREILISEYVVPVPSPLGSNGNENISANGKGKKSDVLNITLEVNGKDVKISQVD